MNPKVSMVLAVYNGGAKLRESIESIINQSFTDFEFVIVDDASTDTTAELLQEYAKKDSRIVVVTNTENLGLTKSLNKGIRASRGEYIARMDAGDTSEPSRFEKQVAFLDSHPKHGLVGTWAYVIDEDSKRVGVMKYPTEHTLLKKALIRYNPIVHSSIMMRKSVVEACGLYNESWTYAQDYELYFRIVARSAIANLGEYLVSYRISPQSITRNKNKEQTLFAVRARMKAIQGGHYSKAAYWYLLKPFLGSLLSYNTKREIKKRFGK